MDLRARRVMRRRMWCAAGTGAHCGTSARADRVQARRALQSDRARRAKPKAVRPRKASCHNTTHERGPAPAAGAFFSCLLPPASRLLPLVFLSFHPRCPGVYRLVRSPGACACVGSCLAAVAEPRPPPRPCVPSARDDTISGYTGSKLHGVAYHKKRLIVNTDTDARGGRGGEKGVLRAKRHRWSIIIRAAGGIRPLRVDAKRDKYGLRHWIKGAEGGKDR